MGNFVEVEKPGFGSKMMPAKAVKTYLQYGWAVSNRVPETPKEVTAAALTGEQLTVKAAFTPEKRGRKSKHK